MLQVSYAKLADHKGAKRVWLQGKRLQEAGFVPGVQYHISIDEASKAVILELTDGDHIVSRKKVGEREVPVIDVCNQDLRDLFGDGVERVKVEIREHIIRITIHPDDAAVLERTRRLIHKLQNNIPLDIGSVAHGGGVLDNAIHTGLARTGIASRTAFAIEIEQEYLEASLRNNPIWGKKSLAVLGPMEEVEPHILGECDLLAAGIPCVGASVSGKAKNGLDYAEQHESAGHLFLAFLNILKAVNPALLVFENVVPYRETVSYHVITQVLKRWGYDLHETVLDGNEIGALEDRRRLCLVAVTKGIAFDFANLQPVRTKETSLGKVLEEVPANSPQWKEFPYLAEKEKRDIEAGKGFRRQLVNPESTSVGTIGAGYAKCRSTEPFVTHPTDPKRSRLLTVKEHARVKTIPEMLVDGVSNTTGHEILGNSVIHTAFVAVAVLIGRTVKQWVDALLVPLISQPIQPTLLATRTGPAQASLF